MRVINLGVRVSQPTKLVVQLPGVDSTAVLRIARDGNFMNASTLTFQSGTSAGVPLTAGDYVMTLDSSLKASATTPFTVTAGAGTTFMSAGAPVNNVRPLIGWQTTQLSATDPKDPWPPPPPPPPPGSLAALFVQASPITNTMNALLAAFSGKGAEAEPPKIHALLVGIDDYPQGPGQDGAIYKPLRGAVRDILAVEQFLREQADVPAERITRLIAATADGPGAAIAVPAELQPTYANIIAAWQRVIEKASPGDIVYIHYSGHGGRAKTLFPALKKNRPIDESIAPTDINTVGRYLRDYEIATLLAQMSDKGIFTTVVLDSCHSGSATRGDEAQARAGDRADLRDRDQETPDNSAVASRAELEAVIRLLEQNTRDATWKIDEQGNASTTTTVLAACRQDELAYEYSIDGTNRQGALTYFWLETLRARSARTYRDAYRQTFARVQGVFRQQTPLLIGAENRVVLGTETLAQPASIGILEVDGNFVKLAAGMSTLIDEGARLAIVPPQLLPELVDLATLKQVEVVGVEAAASRAKIVPDTGTDDQPEITTASQAVLVRFSPRVRREIRTLPPPAGNAKAAAVLAELEKLIASDTTNLVANATSNSADFIVSVDDVGGMQEVRILEPNGTVPLPDLRPAITLDTPSAASIVKNRLVHLSRFDNILNLNNNDPQSPLANKLELSLHAIADGAIVEAALPISPRIPVDTNFFLRIRNTAARTLTLAILDLAPGWSVDYVNAQNPLTIDSGKTLDIKLTSFLPPGIERGVDVFKVIGTLEQNDFTWLTLPVLDQPHVSKSATRRTITDPLEQLMQLVSEPPLAMRGAKLAAPPTLGWTEAQIQFEVFR